MAYWQDQLNPIGAAVQQGLENRTTSLPASPLGAPTPTGGIQPSAPAQPYTPFPSIGMAPVQPSSPVSPAQPQTVTPTQTSTPDNSDVIQKFLSDPAIDADKKHSLLKALNDNPDEEDTIRQHIQDTYYNQKPEWSENNSFGANVIAGAIGWAPQAAANVLWFASKLGSYVNPMSYVNGNRDESNANIQWMLNTEAQRQSAPITSKFDQNSAWYKVGSLIPQGILAAGGAEAAWATGIGADITGAASKIAPVATEAVTWATEAFPATTNILKWAAQGTYYGGAAPITSEGSNATAWDIWQGALVGWALGGALSAAWEGVWALKWAANTAAEDLSTRFNRIDPKKITEFAKLTGWETPGEFLVNRWITTAWENTVPILAENFQKSLQQADEGLAAMEGRFQYDGPWKKDFLKTALDDLVTKLDRQESPQLWKAQELLNQYNNGGLSMSDVNAVKRLYQNTNQFSYEGRFSDDAKRATNILDNIRNWQFKTADQWGFSNLSEINKNTQAYRFLLDNLQNKLNKTGGNNVLGLTDWLILSGDSANLPAVIVKHLISSDAAKWLALKALSGWATKANIAKAPIGDIIKANQLKNVIRTSGVSGAGATNPLLPAASGKAQSANVVNVQPINVWPRWVNPSEITPRSKIVNPK